MSELDGAGQRGHELTPRGSGVMEDQLNVPLEDLELLAEVELTTNLIIAASEAEHALPQAEVDRLLGLGEPEESTAGRVRGVIPTQTRHSASPFGRHSGRSR